MQNQKKTKYKRRKRMTMEFQRCKLDSFKLDLRGLNHNDARNNVLTSHVNSRRR